MEKTTLLNPYTSNLLHQPQHTYTPLSKQTSKKDAKYTKKVSYLKYYIYQGIFFFWLTTPPEGADNTDCQLFPLL